MSNKINITFSEKDNARNNQMFNRKERRRREKLFRKAQLEAKNKPQPQPKPGVVIDPADFMKNKGE